MTTPNEDLILKLRGQAYTTCRPDQLCDQAADLLQSQAERIAELVEKLAGRTDYALSLRRRLDTARMESHTLRAQLADAELHTKQVERGLDKALAQLEKIAATEPVAWRGRCTDPLHDWCLFYRRQESQEKFLNMEWQPLFTHPMPAESKDAERYRWLRDCLISPSTHFDDLIVSADKADTLDGVIDAARAKGAK